jgi:hypothetical protein
VYQIKHIRCRIAILFCSPPQDRNGVFRPKLQCSERLDASSYRIRDAFFHFLMNATGVIGA